MKRCEFVLDRLVDLKVDPDTAGDVAECRAHAATCPSCAGQMQRLEMLTSALSADEAFPGEESVNWDGLARATVRRAIDESAAPAGWRAWLAALMRPAQAPGHAGRSWAPARMAWAAGGFVVAAAGVTMMMLSGQPPQKDERATLDEMAAITMTPGNIDHLTVNLARQNTARYLNETRAVLVTLLDLTIDCDKDKVDVSAERAKATELLRRQRLIAAELERVPLSRAQDVCNELERLLVEISTLADCARDDELQTLRDVVEKRQILVRMELLSSELARREASRA